MNGTGIQQFESKKVLITGGIGFIGSNLTRRLIDAGAQVTVVDNLSKDFGGNPYNLAGVEDQVRILCADMCDVAKVGPILSEQDYLFNLAAQVGHVDSMQDPLTDLKVNALDQIALLELCRNSNPSLRIVYAGTRQIYGRLRSLPVDEEHPLEPVDYNGVSKLAGEWYHRVSYQVYGQRTTSLRMTNVYGPRMRIRDSRKSFVGKWLGQLLEGKELTVYGDGNQVRDLNYVDDVVDALLLAAINPLAEGQVYNLGAPPIRLLELARLLIQVNGSGSFRLEPFPPERERIDIGNYYGNYTRARDQLGWTPATSLRDGIAATLEYYRSNLEHYI